MRRRIALACIAALGALAACGGDRSATTPTSKPTTHDVNTIGNAFIDGQLQIAAGDTVRWNFAGGSDGLGHNVRFTPAVAGMPADIAVLKTGSATRVFGTKGDFHYVCDVHPGMTGEVIVQ